MRNRRLIGIGGNHTCYNITYFYSSTSLEDSMKHMKPKKQVSTKSKASPQSGFLSSYSKCATSGSTLEAAVVGNEQEADTKDIKGWLKLYF